MRRGLLQAIGLSLSLAVVSATASPAAAAEVVVNPARAEDGINRSLLRGMFGMRVRSWPDGTPVRVFVLRDADPVHVDFATAILQMYPYQLRQNWDRLVYSGTGQPPIDVATEEEMLRRVGETPGAIGYLGNPAADAAAGKVRVLNVR